MPDTDLDAYLNPAPKPRRISRGRGSRLSSDQIASTLRQAGWDERHVPTMVAIAEAESSGNPLAHNRKYPDDSYGLLQVNRLAHPEFSPETLRDPVGNAKAALNVFRDKKQGFKAWSTYSSGAYKKHLRQSPQKPQGDLDAYLDPLEQSPPPNAAKQSATSPAEATTAPPQPRGRFALAGKGAQWAGPTIRRGRRQAQSPLSERDRLMRQSGQQRTIDQLQREQEAQLRTEAESELKSRRGPYGSPTLTGALKVISEPIRSFQDIFKSDEEQINEMVGGRQKQAQIAQDPEVTEARKRYGQMSTPRRIAEASVNKTGAELLKTAGGLAGGLGVVPKEYLPSLLSEFSEWTTRRGELIESAASLAPLQKKRNLTSLITGDPELEELQRGVPEKIATGISDLGLSLGQIILLKKTTKLSFPNLLALEAAAKNSNKPASEQLARAAEGYALGSSLERLTSRAANAAVSGVPTAAQTGYEVSQGRMSPLDAAIQTGIQTGVGAALPPARPGLSSARRERQLYREQYLDQIRQAEHPDEVTWWRGKALEAGLSEAEVNKTIGERVSNESSIETQPDASALDRAVDTPPSTTQAEVPVSAEVQPRDISQQSQPDVRGVPVEPQKFYHRDYGEVVKSPDQQGARRGRTKIYEAENPDKVHYIKDVQLTGAGNQRAVPVRTPLDPRKQFLAEQGLTTSEARDLPPSFRAQLEAEYAEWQAGRTAKPEAIEEYLEPSDIVTKPVIEVRNVGEAGDVKSASLPTSTTSARKSQFADDRAELDLPELPPAQRKSWQQSLGEAKPEEAGRLADEVLRRPRPLNDSETASLVTRAQQLKNEHAELTRQLVESTDANEIARQSAQREGLEAEFDRLTEATKASGTEKGRTLAAQKLTINQDYDLVSMVGRFRSAAGRKETPAERTRIEDLQQRIVKAEAERDSANERATQAELQKQVNRVSRFRKRTETKQSLDDEFAQLRAQFAQARAETKGVQASGLAGLDPEGKLTKLIGQMARNRVRAGVTDAAQLVDDIHAALEGQFSKRTIAETISGYGLEPRPDARSEAQKQLAQIKSELKRSLGSEDVTTGRRLSAADKRRQTQLNNQARELERRIREGDFSEVKRKPPAYTRETLARTKEVEQLKAEYNKMRYRATRGRGGMISDELAKAANVPKTLKSIGDISAVFRQGGYYALTHPVEGLAKPTHAMLRSISELGWRNVEAEIKADPEFTKLRDAGVEFTGVDKADPNLIKREEGFLGGEYLDLIAKGKYNVIGKSVKGVKDFSERTFVSFLDAQRLYVGKQILRGLTDAQRNDPAELKAIAKLINVGTGRGSLGRRGNQLAPALNIAMFSPRLVASRVQLLNNMVNPVTIARMPPGARKQMIADNAKFVGATMAILLLAKAAGADVTLDPDDAEFLKVRVGNTVYDQLTGLQQPLRTIINLARAATPSKLSSRTLQSGDYYAGKSMKEILDPMEEGSFTRSKLNPALSPLINYATGTDFMGRKFSIGREAKEMLAPLFAKDIVEGFQAEGALGGLRATPSGVGIGVGSYPASPEKPTTLAEKLARRLARPPDGEPREEAEVETDRQRAQLRARSRRGEDVTADIAKLGGAITARQTKAILSARNKTRLYEDVNRLGIREALTVYREATPAQRTDIRPLLERKVALVDALKPDEQMVVRQQLTELGLTGGNRATRPTRESRPSRAARQ